MKEPLKSKHALQEIYDGATFREIGHQLIDLLADHIESVQSHQKPVLNFRSPEEELAYWEQELTSTTGMADFYKNIIAHSIAVHHPNYIGHQIAVPALISSLSGLVVDLLNNGTGVYEMGMASNAMEKIVTDLVSKKIGYDHNASGFLTSGGTLANLTALLAARKAKATTAVWEQGHAEKLALLVSEEAHYCIDRAARILGLGSEGIIKVPVNASFQMRTEVLDKYLNKAKQEGLHVIAIIGCASSTATGSYDNLEEIAVFAQENDLWFHIDGAHGGSVVFSEKYKHLATGIAAADSVVIDFHKMLLTPSLNTALVFKQGEDSYRTFEQKAQYLWDSQQSREWYNSGKRTFECTKLMMSLKVYAIIKMHGEAIFEQNIDRLYGLAREFATMISERSGFELLLHPEANIVNFRYINLPETTINEVNTQIREELISRGNFYIVQTRIGEKRYLRVTIMNPLTQKSDLEALLDEIENSIEKKHIISN